LTDTVKAFINPGDEDNPYRILFNSDLTYGLPPTYILACELDPLLDDSMLLFEILREHGTVTELKVFKGVIHAFLHYSRMLPQSMEAIKHSAEFTGSGCSTGTSQELDKRRISTL
jgi:acetyl esterase